MIGSFGVPQLLIISFIASIVHRSIREFRESLHNAEKITVVARRRRLITSQMAKTVMGHN
jgi:hypothetical protein